MRLGFFFHEAVRALTKNAVPSFAAMATVLVTVMLLGVFDRLNRLGRTIVVITHEDEVAAHAHRVVRVDDGLIVADEAVRVAS